LLFFPLYQSEFFEDIPVSRLLSSVSFCYALRFYSRTLLPIICTVTIDFDRTHFICSIYSIICIHDYRDEMNDGLHNCAAAGDLERIKQLVEGGANIDELDTDGQTALSWACYEGYYDIVVYLAEHGANVAFADSSGTTALHLACTEGNLPTVKFLLEHGANITERDSEGMTALLCAARNGSLQVVQHLLSSEGGASITETDNAGNTALLLAAGISINCHPAIVQWLLEYGGALITDTNDNGASVWSSNRLRGLPKMLKRGYTKGEDGECISVDGYYFPTEETVALTAMLRVMVLHGGPPESLVAELAPPLQQIVQDGARLRARLPAYLTQRRALLNAHCPLLPPLRDLVHGYEEPTTTDELWATGLGALMQRARRSRPERGQLPERRSARLRQKHL
jgi:hypothetical protein